MFEDFTDEELESICRSNFKYRKKNTELLNIYYPEIYLIQTQRSLPKITLIIMAYVVLEMVSLVMKDTERTKVYEDNLNKKKKKIN